MWKIHCLPPRFKSPVLAMVRLTQLFFYLKSEGGGGEAAWSVSSPDLTCAANRYSAEKSWCIWERKGKQIKTSRLKMA